MNKFVIAVYVDNKFGVLTRVTSMFSRRGFNIDTLTVGETESSDYSRITISMSGDGYVRNQMLNQLRKLHNVKKVEILDEDSLTRELLLIKIKNDPKNRQEVLSAVDIFNSKIVDYSTNALCVELTGEPTKINAFIDILKPYGIIEMCRTGIIALDRGETTILEK
ncbi:MAG: acetolactate synthase small subunit [Faecalibacterium sp.]|nr:acetolactate synthase small subunit [Ruminococcus sp.]MCM1392712.1 acetolactate synthase small subunit [Ruminococcus sp.]MCM1485294.1 acetolactate synthase small subunit [Faecalibacterium sp.]